eukprot:5556722-Amphidinium_carterae.1
MEALALPEWWLAHLLVLMQTDERTRLKELHALRLMKHFTVTITKLTTTITTSITIPSTTAITGIMAGDGTHTPGAILQFAFVHDPSNNSFKASGWTE